MADRICRLLQALSSAREKMFLGIAGLALIGSVICAYLSKGSLDEALMVYDSPHECGRVRQGDSVSATFRLVNRSSQPIDILRVARSCDCADEHLSKSSLMPA